MKGGKLIAVVGVVGIIGGGYLLLKKPLEEGDIRLANLTITPSQVLVGEPVAISVTATNEGPSTGTKTIICTII